MKDELLEHYVATTRAIVVGDPESDATQVGPLELAGQRETVEGMSPAASTRAPPCWRAGRVPTGRARGRLLPPPTILDGCTNDMTVAREEIFGPVVSVITFETEEEAVRIANDTPYGLSGSLWTPDGARQLRVARALRTGAIGVNSNSSSPAGAVRRLQGFRGRQGARHGGPRPQHRAQERVHLDGVEPASGSSSERPLRRRPSRSLASRASRFWCALLLRTARRSRARSRAILAIVVCFDAIRYLRCLVSDVIGDPRQRFTARRTPSRCARPRRWCSGSAAIRNAQSIHGTGIARVRLVPGWAPLYGPITVLR